MLRLVNHWRQSERRRGPAQWSNGRVCFISLGWFAGVNKVGKPVEADLVHRLGQAFGIFSSGEDRNSFQPIQFASVAQLWWFRRAGFPDNRSVQCDHCGRRSYSVLWHASDRWVLDWSSLFLSWAHAQTRKLLERFCSVGAAQVEWCDLQLLWAFLLPALSSRIWYRHVDDGMRWRHRPCAQSSRLRSRIWKTVSHGLGSR